MIVLDHTLLEEVVQTVRDLAQRQTDNERECLAFPVWLHIYDLGDLSKYVLNNWLAVMGGLGAFHCGIEVLGAEWAYQAIPRQHTMGIDKRTGVMCHRPKGHPVHSYRESVYLGESSVQVGAIWNTLLALEQKWLASCYHAINHNCVDFAEIFAEKLRTPEPFPAWVRGIAKGLLSYTPLAYIEEDALPGSCASNSGCSAGSKDLKDVEANSHNGPDDSPKKVVVLDWSANSTDFSEADRRLPTDAETPRMQSRGTLRDRAWKPQCSDPAPKTCFIWGGSSQRGRASRRSA